MSFPKHMPKRCVKTVIFSSIELPCSPSQWTANGWWHLIHSECWRAKKRGWSIKLMLKNIEKLLLTTQRPTSTWQNKISLKILEKYSTKLLHSLERCCTSIWRRVTIMWRFPYCDTWSACIQFSILTTDLTTIKLHSTFLILIEIKAWTLWICSILGRTYQISVD